MTEWVTLQTSQRPLCGVQDHICHHKLTCNIKALVPSVSDYNLHKIKLEAPPFYIW